MSKRLWIYGAGMAGLLAANMLRRFNPIVFEAQTSLPNNHNALLRFRSDAVSKATGIPFKKVNVQKAIFYKNDLITKPDLRLSNLYAAKVTGKVLTRSILNLESVDRWIAPPDFIPQMASSCTIECGVPWVSIAAPTNHIISTIPMPDLMKMAGWTDKWDGTTPDFQSQKITSVTAEVNDVDVYQTLYYPGDEPYYRASITGNKVIIEMMEDWWANQIPEGHQQTLTEQMVRRVLSDFGIQPRFVNNVSIKVQRHGKIVPIDPELRKAFILAMTDLYRIYSLGRFATWRQLLLDDLVEDVRLIERLISQRSSYELRLSVHQ